MAVLDNHTMPSPLAVVLVDHGSRREPANALVGEVADLLAGHTGTVPVYAAHMELASPSLEDALANAARAGAERIVVVPYMLGPGRHATEDIPRMAAEFGAQHPALEVTVAEPLGVHRGLVPILLDRIRDCGEARIDEGHTP